MAKLSDLVAVLAPVDGRDIATLEWFGRRLQEGGVLHNPGRGRPALDVTARDAFSLLAALNGADAAKNAAAHVAMFRHLVPSPMLDKFNPVFAEGSFTAPLHAGLMRAATFGEAIEVVIAGGAYWLLWLAMADPGENSDWLGAVASGTAGLAVDFIRLGPSPVGGRIAIWHVDPDGGRVTDFDRRYTVRAAALAHPEYLRIDTNIDRTTMTTIGARTIVAVIHGLNPETEGETK